MKSLNERALEKFIYLLIMEHEQHENKQSLRLLSSLNHHNIDLVLSFLDSDSIISIVESSPARGSGPRRLISKAKTHAFLLKYLNRSDRSIYMSVYADSCFLSIERQQLARLTSTQSQGISLLSRSCQRLFQHLQSELNKFMSGQQIVGSLLQSLTDPEMPFPKLRKQDIGMHCNSSFQYYLVDRLFPNQQEDYRDEKFEELGRYLEGNWKLSAHNDRLELDIIDQVFSGWFKITYQNYPHYLLQGNGEHNFVVLLVAIIDLFVDSFSFYIQAIQDPLYAFIEFNTRFNIFRNVLLSLEDKVSPIFTSYSKFCKSVLLKKKEMQMDVEGQDPREMTIWHIGLSKWYIYMQHLHQNFFNTYFYLLKKTNLKYLHIHNHQKLSQDQAFVQLQNRLELSQVDMLGHGQFFEVHSPIEDILEADIELINQSLRQYMEYIVDISVNEYSVHWCGHSQQVLHIPYQQFHKMLVSSYSTYIQEITKLAETVSHPVLALDSLLSDMIEQLDREFLKPVTLVQVLQQATKALIQLNQGLLPKQMHLQQLIQNLNHQIQERDKVMQHFNHNAGISNQINYKFSIVLESEDFTKMLKTSASTNASAISNSGHLQMQSIRSSDSILEEDFL